MSTSVFGRSGYASVPQNASADMAETHTAGRPKGALCSNLLSALAGMALALSFSRLLVPPSTETLVTTPAPATSAVPPPNTPAPTIAAAAPIVAAAAPFSYRFPIPKTAKKVMIDIGLYDVILQPEEDEFVIAVDASLREIERNALYTMCDQLQRCFLINAAVGKSEDPFLVLHQSNRKGGSSHVGKFDPNIWPMELKDVIVPMVSLKTLIDSVPDHLSIPLCKTDTNGNDVFVIASAGESLKRCERVTMEVVGDADHTGPPGQYETAIGSMLKLGFVLAPGQESTKREKGSYNLFFCRPEVVASYAAHEAGSHVKKR